MVYLTRILGYVKVAPRIPRKYKRSGFLDLLPIKVKAGSGGSGLPKYGGVGGEGGSVYIRAKEGIDLVNVSKTIKGQIVAGGLGTNSHRRGIIGQPGNDVTINVPPGVVAKTTNGVCLGEVNEPGSRLLVAKGGSGGNADNGFCGQRGQMHTILLDLKLIADVALVGFPNAGKSTLLKKVSGCNTKIASYPFTTVKPHLGIMQYRDYRVIKMADLPGLIEGSHMNIGMGHRFLKHLERCKMMLFVVDIQGFQLSHKYELRNCLETIVLLNKEIELYKEELMDIPAMLMINKMDTPNAREIYKEIEPKIKNLKEHLDEFPEPYRPEKVMKFKKIITTSLINSVEEDIDEIKDTIRSVLDEIQMEQNEYEDTNADLQLYNKLRAKIKQEAPTLV